MGSWTNNDGLFIQYGPDAVDPAEAGEYRFDGPLNLTELELTLTDLSTSANYFLSDTVTLPAGARIVKVEMEVETAATSGGSATLDVGLIRTDRTTAYDDDGLIAALALAEMSDAGANILFTPGSDSTPAGESGIGALVGTTLANSGLLIASANTAVFTAGKVLIRVYWRKP